VDTGAPGVRAVAADAPDIADTPGPDVAVSDTADTDTADMADVETAGVGPAARGADTVGVAARAEMAVMCRNSKGGTVGENAGTGSRRCAAKYVTGR
jgi:hypothetical protein